MHKIRVPFGLHPRPHWGSLQRSYRPLDIFKGPTSKGRGERKVREGERKGEGKGKGRDGEGKGKERGRDRREGSGGR